MNRLTHFAIGLTMLMVVSAFAEDVPKDTPPRPLAKLKVGDSATIETIKTRTITRKGQAAVHIQAKWLSEFSVVDADQKQVVVAWTRHKMQLIPEQIMPDSAKAIVDIWKDIGIELVIDRAQGVKDIRNFEEVNRNIDQTLDVAKRLMREEGADEQTIRQATEAAKKMFADRRQLAALLAKDAMGVLEMMWWQEELTEPGTFEAETELPPVFGNEPLPATLAVQVHEPDEQGRIRIKYVRKPDPEKTAAHLKKWVAQLAPQVNAEEMERAFLKMKIEDTAEYLFDPATHWIHSGSFVRNASGGEGDSRVERWEWRRVEKESLPK